MDLLPLPEPGELLLIPALNKSEARPLTLPWLVFLFLRLGRWLRIEWARKVYEEFAQEISGVAWWYTSPSDSLIGHESVHNWQASIKGRAWYFLNYFNPFDRVLCLHFEAMACAYQVVVHGAQPEARARMLFNGPYWLRKTLPEIREVIDTYSEALVKAGWVRKGTSRESNENPSEDI